MQHKTKRAPIRVGVIGVGRGKSFTGDAAKAAGFELVALCDTWEEKLNEFAKQKPGVATYTDYDQFLEHDMDAVVLANYFHEHAPFAIKALKAGKHVMSETSACMTLSEGVELIRAVEKSGKTYLFAENYPYMRHNQELHKQFRRGNFGTFMYGECEYVHPMSADEGLGISPGIHHWRNWIPSTYYSTHAMAPIMYITDTWPVKVNGFVIRCAPDDPVAQRRVASSDAASMIAVRMDNQAVVKLLGVTLRNHNVCTRLHTAKGYMLGEGGRVTLTRQQWHEKRKYPETMTYTPDFPVMHELAMKAGHGGGDFFTLYYFAEAIRKQEQPYLDVYRGVAMSIVGIQAYRSALADGTTMEIPDFRKESDRKHYEKDDWNPDPAKRKPGHPWSSIDGNKTPSTFALNYARKIWKKIGYTES